MACACSTSPERPDATPREAQIAMVAERYRMLFDLESDAIMLVDHESGRILEANATALSLYGYDIDELRAMRSLDLAVDTPACALVPDDAESRSGDSTRTIHVPLRFHRRKDGAVFPVEITGRLFEDHGRPMCIVAIRNITSRWHAERALQESEERFRTMLEDAPDGIMVQVDGLIAYANSAAMQMLGAVSPADLVGTPILDRCDPDNREQVRARMQTLNVERERVPPMEQNYVRLDGTTVQVDVSAAPITYLGKPGALVFARDITRRKQLESDLAHTQKLDSIGRVAGGIAHDFNNMLNVIGGYTELALARLWDEDPLYGHLREVKQAAERATELTRQLLAFSMRQANAPILLDLSQRIQDSERMIRRLLGEATTLRLQLYPGPAAVRIDPAQLEQVLVNLLANSRDAVAGAGTVRIETDVVSLAEALPSHRGECPPGSYVVLSVTDNGRGMDDATLAHMFEPFFTTRRSSGATGLGLAVVYGVVRQHHGCVDVSSAPGRGTRFRVFLPLQQAAVLPGRRERQPAIAGSGGHEVILVVEDEDQLRKLVVTALERSGYTVLQAGLPEEALAVVRERQGGIDVLLTDVIMPGMDGAELQRRMLRIRPGIRTLFMSGYTANIIGEHGILEGGIYFIQKPFSVRDLMKKIRELID